MTIYQGGTFQSEPGDRLAHAIIHFLKTRNDYSPHTFATKYGVLRVWFGCVWQYSYWLLESVPQEVYRNAAELGQRLDVGEELPFSEPPHD